MSFIDVSSAKDVANKINVSKLESADEELRQALNNCTNVTELGECKEALTSIRGKIKTLIETVKDFKGEIKDTAQTIYDNEKKEAEEEERKKQAEKQSNNKSQSGSSSSTKLSYEVWLKKEHNIDINKMDPRAGAYLKADYNSYLKS